MASTATWFETVAEAQRRARKRLPPSVYGALLAGTEQGITMTDNSRAFDELGFRPQVGDQPSERDQATTVLGQHISLPVLLSPTGVQAVHPEAEVAAARAAAAAGTAMGLSSFGSRAIEDVVQANPQTFFQTYWVGDRDRIARRVERAKAAGAKALIVTLDWVFDSRRDWGSPPIPERLDLKAMARFAPEGVRRPRYMLGWLRHRHLPDLTVPNMADPGEDPPTFFQAYGEWMQTPPPTWEDLRWLRERWGGPFMVKGVTRPTDARKAVDIGADAISVSNHGGNNLDGAPGSIRVLPSIVDEVGDEIEVLLDGGVRRGLDAVKAIALGARAVMIGRPYLWGLAANGQAGVENVLDVLRSGIDEALFGLGRASLADLEPGDLTMPSDFTLGPRPYPAAQTPRPRTA
ncbi:mycofactocin biosynthesis FMN-dependent deaminase MftD [Pseudonocardia sp. KRD-184]|uniref:Mycofactocin biosynthesis FMN-dependent deaminase MftD n=1 Tax=Pseudonocardia oceani TaxID=2792013 RepID=A0ABS6U822_9PSEU|nr:pre-mycofactocin synthase MftD [Pseudonocardia oceani]MBW0091060.1 mycofactocin biosynthesis FMN-dependent deaminase MftD [Pseudonocardia oceani]MBW0097727.1 mycofactocin biosynthesis FMN-dependent deaminase MftD [Pseudonocardia oceani]MBW0110247.1 mycofactocin biosynthesis FMN-dependent deaminase MftD [Pseudonocardia oceani]MBW0122905.1 mycofactocin biosynthesis FMN-dependent deaminase MftD [Pseudonocardia oceani]MBW0128111.1 mycofactocin biosynthesis FMN-dependent deaminase MftD [Pseudono